jgi:hypothetical protein
MMKSWFDGVFGSKEKIAPFLEQLVTFELVVIQTSIRLLRMV